MISCSEFRCTLALPEANQTSSWNLLTPVWGSKLFLRSQCLQFLLELLLLRSERGGLIVNVLPVGSQRLVLFIQLPGAILALAQLAAGNSRATGVAQRHGAEGGQRNNSRK